MSEHLKSATSPPADISRRLLDGSSIRFGISAEHIASLDTETSEFTVIGQPRAMRALNMAVRIPARGYNVFATGPQGTGKRTAIRAVLEAYNPGVEHLCDIAVVYGFNPSNSPCVLTLPRGEGRELRRLTDELIDALRRIARNLLEKQQFKREKDRILLSNEGWENQLVTDFERRLAADGFTVVHAHEDEDGQADVYPMIDGEAVTFDELQRMLTAGTLDEETWNSIRERYYHYLDELKSIYQKMHLNREDMERSLEELTVDAVRPDLEQAFAPLREHFPEGSVREHIDRLFDDVERHLAFFLPDGPEKDDDGSPPLSRYRVNLLVDHADTDRVPVIFESNPDYPTLFGTQEPVPEESSEHRSGFMMLRSGSVLKASGGYLVLRAEDILPQEDSWAALKRVLQYGETGIRPPAMPFAQPGTGLKAENIPVNVKVIITGSEYVYELLYYGDEEIQKLFKIPAEFDSYMPRNEQTMQQYIHFMRFITREEGLAELTHDAMAAIAEYGVRLSEFREKLSTRFSMIADLIREAHHFRR
ncbi:MAG: AAA family ATPase, partial [bacterium]